MTIDPNSPSYLFGRIMTEIEQLKTMELKAVKDQLKELNDEQVNITTLLNNLPCERDDIRIKNLEKKLLQNGSTGSKLHRLLTPALTTGNIGFILLVLYVIAKAEGWLP